MGEVFYTSTATYVLVLYLYSCVVIKISLEWLIIEIKQTKSIVQTNIQ